MGRALRALLLLVVLILAVKGAVSLMPSDEAPPGVQPVPPPPVRILTLAEERLELREERHARLLPSRSWTLSFEVGGRLASRPVDNGSRVEQGALLAALDPEPFEAEQERAQANLESATARLDLAKVHLKRIERLRTGGSATTDDLDQAQTARDEARAALSAADAALRLAKHRLRHASLRAPAAGVVSHLRAEEGEFLAPGQPVGRLERVDLLLVKVLVSADVRRGLEVGAAAELVDEREQVHAGAVVRAAPVQSEGTGQFELEVEVPNPEGRLLAGEAVRCRFVHGRALPRLRVPRHAVYEEYGLWRALVPPTGPEPAGPFRADSVGVVLGIRDPQEGWVEILSGLKPGERVLVPARAATVREGQRVAVGPLDGSPGWLPPYAGAGQ